MKFLPASRRVLTAAAADTTIITRGTSAAADTDTITQRITSVAEVMGMQTVMNAAEVTITKKITSAAAGTTTSIRIFL